MAKIYRYDAEDNVLDEIDGRVSTSSGRFNEYVLFNGKSMARRDSSGYGFYYFAD